MSVVNIYTTPSDYDYNNVSTTSTMGRMRFLKELYDTIRNIGYPAEIVFWFYVECLILLPKLKYIMSLENPLWVTIMFLIAGFIPLLFGEYYD